MTRATATNNKWRRRSRQEWETVFAQFAASGLGVEPFCAREGLSESSFRRWRRLLGEETPRAILRPPLDAQVMRREKPSQEGFSALCQNGFPRPATIVCSGASFMHAVSDTVKEVVDGAEPWWRRWGFEAQKAWSARCWTSFCCVHTTVSKVSKNEKPTALGGFFCLLYAYCDFSRCSKFALSH